MANKGQNLIVKNLLEELKPARSNFANKKKSSALNTFKSIPIPKNKEEGWRYTKIEKLNLGKFKLSNSNTIISATKLSEELVGKGVILTDINTALEKFNIARNYFFKNMDNSNDKIIALNAAYFNNGIFLYVPKNIEIEEPIMANFYFERQSSVIRNMVIAEPNSKVDFIEEYSNKKVSSEQLNSCATEIFANEGSKINFYHLNNLGKNIYNFTNIVGTAEKNAEINWFSGCFGGKINKLKIDAVFNGQYSKCSNVGVFIGKRKENINITTNAYHNAENTINDILIDGILKDESISTCRGLIKIEKSAQKTDSYLANHILKLSDKTLANSIPSLKIDANDVKASHEATIGQIGEEHLFYLMSRGLPRESAEKLIVDGFFEPVIEKMQSEEFKERIRELVKDA